MNTIATFGKCTLSNDELLKRVDQLCDYMYLDGKIPSRNIPAKPDNDFDLLVGELILRFKESSEPLPDSHELKELTEDEIHDWFCDNSEGIFGDEFIRAEDALFKFQSYLLNKEEI